MVFCQYDTARCSLCWRTKQLVAVINKTSHHGDLTDEPSALHLVLTLVLCIARTYSRLGNVAAAKEWASKAAAAEVVTDEDAEVHKEAVSLMA